MPAYASTAYMPHLSVSAGLRPGLAPGSGPPRPAPGPAPSRPRAQARARAGAGLGLRPLGSRIWARFDSALMQILPVKFFFCAAQRYQYTISANIATRRKNSAPPGGLESRFQFFFPELVPGRCLEESPALLGCRKALGGEASSCDFFDDSPTCSLKCWYLCLCLWWAVRRP